MKKLFLLLFLSLSFTCMAEEVQFHVCKKEKVTDFMVILGKQAAFTTEFYNNGKIYRYRVLDIEMDNCSDGWAKIKFEIYSE